MATHSSILPVKSHGQRSLEGYSPWGGKVLDMTKAMSTHTWLLHGVVDASPLLRLEGVLAGLPFFPSFWLVGLSSWLFLIKSTNRLPENGKANVPTLRRFHL